METKKILKYAGIGIIAIFACIFVAMGFVVFDVMSYTATGSEKLNSNTTAVGKAMVVYDPGISGETKEVSAVIAKDLQDKGYSVVLAGIKSADAQDTSGYNVIIVGGPTYGGKISSSVQSYLKSIKLENSTKFAVFATGQDSDVINNETELRKALIVGNTTSINVVAVMKVISGENPDEKSADFVTVILNSSAV